jgi:HD-GYP domain-containing protein (c-di-GMP phosphodiesterase class II)
MTAYSVSGIPPASYFTKTVYLDPRFIIAAPETPFSEDLARILGEWGFREVYSDGEPMADYALDNRDSAGGNSADGGEVNGSSSITDLDKIQRAEEFYAAFQRYVERLFTHITVRNKLDCNAVAERVKAACNIVREDRRFLMRARQNIGPAADQNYLASHAVRSMVIAIIIGTYLKLPTHRLIELGVAALLHEIGMLKLSRNVYLSGQPLTAEEKKKIYTHPVTGYNMLKSFGFPLVICLAALEHHERENGGGYPRQLGGSKISLYSKIIAVACSYEALSSNRPHKEAKDGYTGMLELLKNEGKQYDDTVVRALVYSLSIYPIGLHVLLSSGKKGQVVDVNPENPRCPIVQIFGEITPDGKNKIAQTAPGGLSIVRPLTREEAGG